MEGPAAHTRYQPWFMSLTIFYLPVISKYVNSGFLPCPLDLHFYLVVEIFTWVSNKYFRHFNVSQTDFFKIYFLVSSPTYLSILISIF